MRHELKAETLFKGGHLRHRHHVTSAAAQHHHVRVIDHDASGAQYWVEGKAAPGGECGINTSGGLIAKGHPIGATGVAMIGWSALQLLHKVPPELQVKNARMAATFNIGGPVCASVCTVLRPV